MNIKLYQLAQTKVQFLEDFEGRAGLFGCFASGPVIA